MTPTPPPLILSLRFVIRTGLTRHKYQQMRYSHIPEQARKYHYYRGFAAASIVLVPIILVLIVACNVAIDALLLI